MSEAGRFLGLEACMEVVGCIFLEDEMPRLPKGCTTCCCSLGVAVGVDWTLWSALEEWWDVVVVGWTPGAGTAVLGGPQTFLELVLQSSSSSSEALALAKGVRTRAVVVSLELCFEGTLLSSSSGLALA